MRPMAVARAKVCERPSPNAEEGRLHTEPTKPQCEKRGENYACKQVYRSKSRKWLILREGLKVRPCILALHAHSIAVEDGTIGLAMLIARRKARNETRVARDWHGANSTPVF